ncbi:MAG: hypothetical protein R3B70_15365 [Polyangiaceae bacterium]
MSERKASIDRKTLETDIRGAVARRRGPRRHRDGRASSITCCRPSTKHARFDVTLRCKGDLHIDDHTAEDCAIALGQALDGAGERRGIARFGTRVRAARRGALARGGGPVGPAVRAGLAQAPARAAGDLSCEMIRT